MDMPVEHYWEIRLNEVKEALEANNFEAFIVENADEARELVMKEIVPHMGAKSLSWGGSMTLLATKLQDAFRGNKAYKVIDTADTSVSPQEFLDRRRQALLVDLFLVGTNAVTESGQLVNLDGTGNRVAALAFGPKHVVVLVGRNKVVADVDEAMYRITNYAAPTNAMRLDRKTPCVNTSYCENCSSPERICNTWTITEKSNPKGRVKVVLINEELGL